MSLAGTLLMEEPYNPSLIETFRERMVLPERRRIRDTIQQGINRGQIRPDLDVEPTLDLLLGALFAAVFAAAARIRTGQHKSSTPSGQPYAHPRPDPVQRTPRKLSGHPYSLRARSINPLPMSTRR
jgi:Tetracyclin repressor-like, C-terminal domain